MPFVPVEIVNNSGLTVRMTLEEGGEMHDYLCKLVRRERLVSVEAIQPEHTPRRSAGRGKIGA